MCNPHPTCQNGAMPLLHSSAELVPNTDGNPSFGPLQSHSHSTSEHPLVRRPGQNRHQPRQSALFPVTETRYWVGQKRTTRSVISGEIKRSTNSTRARAKGTGEIETAPSHCEGQRTTSLTLPPHYPGKTRGPLRPPRPVSLGP